MPVPAPLLPALLLPPQGGIKPRPTGRDSGRPLSRNSCPYLTLDTIGVGVDVRSGVAECPGLFPFDARSSERARFLVAFVLGSSEAAARRSRSESRCIETPTNRGQPACRRGDRPEAIDRGIAMPVRDLDWFGRPATYEGYRTGAPPGSMAWSRPLVRFRRPSSTGGDLSLCRSNGFLVAPRPHWYSCINKTWWDLLVPASAASPIIREAVRTPTVIDLETGRCLRTDPQPVEKASDWTEVAPASMRAASLD